MADCWHVLHFHCPAPSTVLLQIRMQSNAVGSAKIAGGHPGDSVIYLRLGRSYLLQGQICKKASRRQKTSEDVVRYSSFS